MTRDPLTTWAGVFPYDALAPAGITPNSTMKQVKDALFDLMTQGPVSHEARAAWDELRITQRRLLVDFFLYQFDAEEVLSKAIEKLDEQISALAQMPDVSYVHQISLEDLNQMQQDLRNIPVQEVQIRFLSEFEGKPALPDLTFIQFDT